MLGSALVGVFQLLLIQCCKASESPYQLNINVGNDVFPGHTFRDSPRQEFNGYFVKLDDPSGCAANLKIIDHNEEEEISKNTLVPYIDWYSSSDLPCGYDVMVSNLKNISISHFILVIASRNFLNNHDGMENLDQSMTFVIFSPDEGTFDKFQSLASYKGNLVYIGVEIPAENEENTSIPMSSMAILFVTVAFVTLMTVSIGWLVFYYAQRCRQRNMRERLQSRLCVAAKRAVGKLPTKTVPDQPKSNKRSKKTSPPIPDNDSTCSSCSSDDGEFCPVCLDLYKPREVIRILPCKHEFHKNCVDPWLFDHRTCPMCKLDILEHLGMPPIGDRLSSPTMQHPPEYSENFSTRVDQEVQTDFASPSPAPHYTAVAADAARNPRNFGEEIEPAPISPQDV